MPQSFTHGQIVSSEEGMLTQLLSTLPYVLIPYVSHFLYFISVHYWWSLKVDWGGRCQRNCSSLSQTQTPARTLLPALFPEEHWASVEEVRPCNRKHHCYWLQGTQSRVGPAGYTTHLVEESNFHQLLQIWVIKIICAFYHRQKFDIFIAVYLENNKNNKNLFFFFYWFVCYS